jgi:hypothetical protein
MAAADAIVCDHMPIGLALCTMRRSGIDYFFEPPRRAKPPVVAADAEITLEFDDVPMSDVIRGYNRLRGF